MTNKEFAEKLEKRTLDFAIMILKLCAKLPNTIEAQVIRYQLAKSGTSVGANDQEANCGRSKADLVFFGTLGTQGTRGTQYTPYITLKTKYL